MGSVCSNNAKKCQVADKGGEKPKIVQRYANIHDEEHSPHEGTQSEPRGTSGGVGVRAGSGQRAVNTGAVSEMHAKFHKFPSVFATGAGISSLTGLPCLQDYGSCVLVASEDGSMALVHYRTGFVRQRWTEAHDREVCSVTTPLPESMQFLSCSRDKTVKLWQLQPDELPKQTPRRNSFSPPSSSAPPLATCVGHTLNVTCVDHHPSGALAVSGSRDNSVRLWDLARGGEEMFCGNIKLNLVNFVKFFPGISCVVQGGEDRTIRLWDLRIGQSKSTLELLNTMEGEECFATCGISLASSIGHADAALREDPYHLITGHNGANGCGCFVKEWDLRSPGKEICTHRGHRNSVVSVCPSKFTKPVQDSASPSPSLSFASCSADSVVYLWEKSSSTTSSLTPIDELAIGEGITTCMTTAFSPPAKEKSDHSADESDVKEDTHSSNKKKDSHDDDRSAILEEDLIFGVHSGGIIVLKHTGPNCTGLPRKRYRYFGEMQKSYNE